MRHKTLISFNIVRQKSIATLQIYVVALESDIVTLEIDTVTLETYIATLEIDSVTLYTPISKKVVEDISPQAIVIGRSKTELHCGNSLNGPKWHFLYEKLYDIVTI